MEMKRESLVRKTGLARFSPLTPAREGFILRRGCARSPLRGEGVAFAARRIPAARESAHCAPTLGSWHTAPGLRLLLGVWCFLGAWSLELGALSAAPRPNIIFLLADDL